MTLDHTLYWGKKKSCIGTEKKQCNCCLTFLSGSITKCFNASVSFFRFRFFSFFFFFLFKAKLYFQCQSLEAVFSLYPAEKLVKYLAAVIHCAGNCASVGSDCILYISRYLRRTISEITVCLHLLVHVSASSDLRGLFDICMIAFRFQKSF